MSQRKNKKVTDPLTALRALVDACEYVRPIAGAVCVRASVKNIREAGRFLKAVEQARAVLAANE